MATSGIAPLATRVLGLAVLALASGAAAHTATDSLIAHELDREGSAVSQSARLVWIIQAEDCLSCANPAPLMRSELHGAERAGAVMPLALSVGGDTTSVHQFLRRERLAGVPVQPSRAALIVALRVTRQTPLPLLVRGKHVLARWPAERIASIDGDSVRQVLGRTKMTRPGSKP